MKPEEEDDNYNDRKKRIEKVRKELGITEETIERDTKALQHWLHRQPHLGPITGVDEGKWLANYLTICKNSMEKAKTGIDLYFTLRNLLPQLFEDRDPTTDLMETSFNATCLASLPDLTDTGQKIVIYTHFTSDADQFDPWTLAKRIMMMLDIILLEGADHSGVILLTDLSNSRKGHLTRYPLSMINKMLTNGWKAYPERLTGIHIIHPPPFLETALNIFKPFLSEKIKDRIKVHSSQQSLQESIPLHILPTDYGGKAPCLKELNRDWQKKMIKHKKWLEETAKHRSKEELRIDKRNDEDMSGSFRSLIID